MEVKMRIKLKEVLTANKMSQKELVALTNIRSAAISEIANNQRTSLNKLHIERIASALKITDISELIELEVIQKDAD